MKMKKKTVIKLLQTEIKERSNETCTFVGNITSANILCYFEGGRQSPDFPEESALAASSAAMLGKNGTVRGWKSCTYY